MNGSGGGINGSDNVKESMIEQVSQLEKLFSEKLSLEQRKNARKNVLIVLDDVIGEIKSLQHDRFLAQLFFNRRHLIANGVVSLMLVTQKYTMIPARIRSNANWLMLFRLNPIDMENVFKDVITINSKRWKETVKFVFGDEDTVFDSRADGGNTFDFLGIWVEKEKYFKNFARIIN